MQSWTIIAPFYVWIMIRYHYFRKNDAISLHSVLEFREKSWIPNFLKRGPAIENWEIPNFQMTGHRKSQNFPKFLIFWSPKFRRTRVYHWKMHDFKWTNMLLFKFYGRGTMFGHFAFLVVEMSIYRKIYWKFPTHDKKGHELDISRM